MRQLVILKCRPNAQFHLGKIALNENTSLNKTDNYIHSDTLFSAIICTLAKVYGETSLEVKTILEALDGIEPVIKMSSAFYCLEGKENSKVYFLPKPISCNLMSSQKNAKKIKKIQFISTDVWEQGITVADWADEEKCVIIDKKFVLLKEEFENLVNLDDFSEKKKITRIEKFKVYNKTISPKVAVHKEDRENSIYYHTNIEIANNDDVGVKTHWYFWLDMEGNITENTQNLFNQALNILVDDGIGGERSIGCGRLEGIDRIKLSYLPKTNGYGCISLCCPASMDEFNEFKYYDLITRGGRRTFNNTLQRIKFIKEGAVLENEVSGTTKNIGGHHLRYGKAFLLPLHSNFTDV